MARTTKSTDTKKATVAKYESSSEETIAVPKTSKSSNRNSSRSPKDKSVPAKKAVVKDESTEDSEDAPVAPKKAAKKSAKKAKVESSEEESSQDAPIVSKKSAKKSAKKAKVESSEEESSQDAPPKATKKKVVASKDKGSQAKSRTAKATTPAILPSRFTQEMIDKIAPIKKNPSLFFLDVGGSMMPGFVTPDLVFNCGGFTVPSIESKHYKREADVCFMRVPLDLSTEGGEMTANMLHAIFEHVGSSAFKRKMFGDKDYKKYDLAASSSISLEPDEYHLANRADKPYVPTIAMKFKTRYYEETEWNKGKMIKVQEGTEGMGDTDDPFIELDLIEERDPEDKSSRTPVLPRSMAVIRETVPFGSTFRIGFALSHIWVVKKEYGIKIVMKKLVVVPRESSALVSYVTDDDTSEEELVLPRATKGNFGSSTKEDSESESSDAKPVAKVIKKATKKAAVSESSEEVQVSAKKSKSAKKVVEASESSSEDVQIEVKKGKKTVKVAIKDDSESESSEKVTLPPKKATKKAAEVSGPSEKEVSSSKKKSAKKVVEASESSSEEAPPKKGSKASKPVVEEEPSDDADDSSADLVVEPESDSDSEPPVTTKRSNKRK